MAGYTLEKKPFVKDTPSLEELAEVLQLKGQHWKPVAQAMHKRWPDLWRGPSEIDEASFYECLVASFRHDADGTRQTLLQVASSKRKNNWQRLLKLPIGALTNGIRVLQAVDPKSEEEIYEAFRGRPILDSAPAVIAALANVGKPEFGRVLTWLMPLYPDLTPDPADQDGPSAPGLDLYGAAFSTTQRDWSGIVADMQEALEQAQAEPFNERPLKVLEAALEELRSLVEVHQYTLNQEYRNGIELASKACARVREGWADATPPFADLLTVAERVLAGPIVMELAALTSFADVLERQVELAGSARAKISDATRAIIEAATANRDTEINVLVEHKQASQVALVNAETAIAEALQRFAEAAGAESALFDGSAAILEPTATEPSDDPLGSVDVSPEQQSTTGEAGDVQTKAVATANDSLEVKDQGLPATLLQDLPRDGDLRQPERPLDGTEASAIAEHGAEANPSAPMASSGKMSNERPVLDDDNARMEREESATVDPLYQTEETPDTTIQIAPLGQFGNRVSDETLFVFHAFCENRWIGPDGRCQHAPWINADFDEKLRNASRQALKDQRLAHLEVFSRALEARGQMALVAADDLRAMVEILTQPASDSAGGTDNPRLPRLLAVVEEEAARNQILIGALLETLKPSDEAPPTDTDRQKIIDAADINSSDLRILLERLLTFRQHGEDGWGKLLKQYQGDETLSDADVSEKLAEARQRFQRRVQQLWSAAAGKIEHPHCRKAWREFMETHVRPLVPVLAIGENADDFIGWNIEKLTSQVRKLPVRHAKIADRGGAKKTDRRTMDKAASEIAHLAADVLRLAQLHSKRLELRNFLGLKLPLRELRVLVTGEPLADTSEELCRLGIQALVNRQPLLDASGITEADRWHLPDLLSMLDIDGDSDCRRWAPVLPVSAIDSHNIVSAAALLMYPGDRTPPNGDLPQALRSRLIEMGRSDLLPYLIGSEEFATEEKTRIQREFNDRVEALNQQLRRLHCLRLDVTALALPCAADVDRAYDTARSLLADHERVLRKLPLIASWLDALISEVQVEVDRNVARLRTEAERIASAEQLNGVLAEIESGRFDRALEGLRDKSALTRRDNDAVRQTAWRREARLRFPQPLNTLQAVAQDTELGELPVLWLRQRKGTDKQDKHVETKLRRAFYDFVSGEGELSPTRKRRIVPKELREIRGTQIVINCGELLKLFAKEGLNPTFVPQLRDFSDLVIASPPFGLTPNNAPNQLSRYVAGERDSRKLVVFLMPGLHEPVRERILAELRGRELRSVGAVLDDLDLCRLIGHDATQRPHGMLGLVELVFEQLSWKDLSPYVSRDGQFIQLEMFVGREREAEKLALTAEYTRVFSGRKLGKSALLKYVEQTYSGTSLPSGNELQVLYIIVAGGDSENWLTDKVVVEIRARFPSAPHVPDESDPGVRLEKFLEAFFHQHKDVSLLVILDEADAFVEGQLKEYDRLRERCLSFRMMKTTFGGVDKNNLPRVRFVFSGYRVTNSRAGAWANAGSVLRLAPLTEEDSINLAIGPLARLGIDATRQAATIARYCGFQPAIIIRFCDALLKHVQLTHAASGRREVTIEYEDVVNTFHQAAVQEEIRTINDNNFQGNRVGRIVFWTMLLAFNDLLSGQGLENAPTKLLRRIRDLDPNTAWLRKLDPSETGEILRNLHDFRNRELIEESRQDGNSVYRMKFPAHLPVLMTEEDPEHQIRQDIQRVREGGHEAHFVTSLLTPKQIDDLHFALGEEGTEMGVTMAVAASPWLEALQDDRAGVVDRLGYRAGDIVKGAALSAEQYDQPTLLIHDARAAVAERLMLERDKSLRPPLLIGGLDLMRWALQQSLNESGTMISCVGLKRLDEARLTWWYERLRNIHFDSQDAIARILDLTSGVPILLAVWENLMPRQAEISREQFGALCDAFEWQMPQLAKQLSSDDPCVALTARELEILQMAARLGREIKGTFQLRDELVDGWRTWALLLEGDIANAPPLLAVEEDEVALSLLTESGFIPVTGRGEVIFLPNDAIYRLLAGDA